MIKTRLLCVTFLSCLFATSSFAFFERTLRFLTGIDLKNATEAPMLGETIDATQREASIQSVARRLLLQMAPYFIVNHHARGDEHALLEDLHRLLDERTFLPARLFEIRGEQDDAMAEVQLTQLVVDAEAGNLSARAEVVRRLFLGLHEFELLNARVRYAAIYILAFNGWNEAAAQIELIHRDGLLDQPTGPAQGATLRMLFQCHQGAAASR